MENYFLSKLVELEHQQVRCTSDGEITRRISYEGVEDIEELKTQVYQESDIDTAFPYCIFDLIERDKSKVY